LAVFFGAYIAEEWGLDIERHGTATFRREDLRKGFEPDSWFYIQNAAAVRGKEEIVLGLDPPPDLVVEVDIASESVDRFPIFAAVGVPEVWHCDGESVVILRLAGKDYAETSRSVALPLLNAEIATAFLGGGASNKPARNG
jgi:Uma2 family endonuclease